MQLGEQATSEHFLEDTLTNVLIDTACEVVLAETRHRTADDDVIVVVCGNGTEKPPPRIRHWIDCGHTVLVSARQLF